MMNSRRRFLGTTTAALAGSAIAACASASAEVGAPQKAAFVLVHGAWHGAWTFSQVVPELAARGHVAVAIDLPGHGLDAKFPSSFGQCPLNGEAFSAERSPLADITLEQCADRAIEAIDKLRAGGFTNVVLVGHSLGGVVLTRVGEKSPEKVSGLMYLTALMLPSGMSAASTFALPQSAGSQVGPLVLGNPTLAGVSRINPESADEDYRRKCKQAFYGDLSDAQFSAVAHLLTPDEPGLLGITPVVSTQARWGSVKRHYIRCLQDHALPPALQQVFIERADAFTPSNRTNVRILDSSHSPFFSMPGKLAASMVELVSS